MTQASLQKLKAKQPDGYRVNIANQVGVTPEYVDMVLRGERKNQHIIDLAIDLAEKHQQFLKKQEERINAL